jgi:hypothetical protein
MSTTTDLPAARRLPRRRSPSKRLVGKRPPVIRPAVPAAAPKAPASKAAAPKAPAPEAAEPKAPASAEPQPVEQASNQTQAKPRLMERVENRLGALPWWVISAAVHAVVFLMIALLATAVAPPSTDEVVIVSDVPKQQQPDYDPQKKRDIFRNPEIQSENVLDHPMVAHEQGEATDQFETDNNMDKSTSRGTEDAISDIPLGGTGTVGTIGAGGGGGGLAGVFGYRDGGGRKKAVGKFGGSEATESSVEAALLWFKRHQEKAGYWDAGKWRDMGGFMWGFGMAGQPQPTAMERTNISMTGLAMLAFLGAGYTSKSGKYKETVEATEKWLLAVLDDRAKTAKYGSFDDCNYTQGMATLAIAEAYGMTKDETLRKAAQAAVDTILARQGKYEAWDYRDKAGKAARNDTSVTGWNLMALKSAKMAGLTVDGTAFQGCMAWLNEATDPATGKCSYCGNIGGAAAGPARGFQMTRGSGSEAMWAAGMLMRQFMGARQDDPILIKAADTISQNQPKWEVTSVPGRTIPARHIPAQHIPAQHIPARTFGNINIPEQNIPERDIPEQNIPEQVIPESKMSQKVNFYYWYYGTLCMFQMGNQYWKDWNKNIKGILVDNQRKGGPMDGTAKDVDGSWDPIGGGNIQMGGRVFSTALGTLTLEVYYRYLPIYSK